MPIVAIANTDAADVDHLARASIGVGKREAAAAQAIEHIGVTRIGIQRATDDDQRARGRRCPVIGLIDITGRYGQRDGVDGTSVVSCQRDVVVVAAIAVADANAGDTDRLVAAARIGIGKGEAATRQTILCCARTVAGVGIERAAGHHRRTQRR